MAQAPDSVEGLIEREQYLKNQFLADFYVLRQLVAGIGNVTRPTRQRLPDICKQLRRARGSDTEETAAAEITEMLRKLGEELGRKGSDAEESEAGGP